MTLQAIPLSWARRQAAGAVASGLSLDHLFERALIAPRFGDERDQISPLQLVLFHATLVQATDDGAHAMTRHRHAPETGPLGLRILFGGADLGDGLAALARFYNLASRSIRLELSIEDTHAFLAIQIDDDRGGGPLQEDIQLSYLYLGLTAFLGRPFPVSWVATRDAEHINLGGTHYAMRSPVRLQNRAGFAFPRGLLGCRSTQEAADDFLWRPMRDALNLIGMSDEGPAAEVNSRALSVGQMASEQMIAPSTLRRRMAQAGSGFRQHRERLLLDATLDLLRTRSYSLDAIAADLGYSDARSLRRFVKRATGRTPNELRQDFAVVVSPAQVRARLKDVISLIPQ